MTHASGLFAAGQTVNTETPASVTTEFHDVYYDYNSAFRPYTFAPWFSSQYLSADASAGTTQTFTIDTPFASSGAAALTVNLWSLTQSSVAEDHALQVLVNGQPAGQAVWSGGNQMLALTFQIPSGALRAGGNQIDLVTPTITHVDSQISFLHSLSVSYTRQLDGSKPVTVTNTSSTSQTYELSNTAGRERVGRRRPLPGPRGAGAVPVAGSSRRTVYRSFQRGGRRFGAVSGCAGGSREFTHRGGTAPGQAGEEHGRNVLGSRSGAVLGRRPAAVGAAQSRRHSRFVHRSGTNFSTTTIMAATVRRASRKPCARSGRSTCCCWAARRTTTKTTAARMSIRCVRRS